MVGSILLIGLCCAAISCSDKLKLRKQRRTLENEVAKAGPETGKSAAVAGHPQSYTVIKNGTQSKTGAGAEPEKVHLVSNGFGVV